LCLKRSKIQGVELVDSNADVEEVDEIEWKEEPNLEDGKDLKEMQG